MQIKFAARGSRYRRRTAGAIIDIPPRTPQDDKTDPTCPWLATLYRRVVAARFERGQEDPARGR